MQTGLKYMQTEGNNKDSFPNCLGIHNHVSRGEGRRCSVSVILENTIPRDIKASEQPSMNIYVYMLEMHPVYL